MCTIVLQAQDCLSRRLPFETLASPSSKQGRSPNRSTKSGRRKRSPSDNESGRRDRSRTMVTKVPAKNLVMGQVTILKRGEEIRSEEKSELENEDGQVTIAKGGEEIRSKEKLELDNKEEKGEIEEMVSKDRLGPEPEMIPKEVRLTDVSYFTIDDDTFAGSGFVASPSPSSLPFPSFFTKKGGFDPSTNDVEQVATQRLIRLLGLNLV